MIVRAPAERRVSTALDRSEVEGAGGTQPPEFIQAVRLILGEFGHERLSSILGTVQVPEPTSAAEYVREYRAAEATAAASLAAVIGARDALDDAVFDWYSTPAADRVLMRAGTPWQTGPEDY
ncbi:MAG: hypothetical protein M3P18_05165 [Actinomycetota bacterium]|nr:hypothetical protein [Actinomycetota bacterium]